MLIPLAYLLSVPCPARYLLRSWLLLNLKTTLFTFCSSLTFYHVITDPEVWWFLFCDGKKSMGSFRQLLLLICLLIYLKVPYCHRTSCTVNQNIKTKINNTNSKGYKKINWCQDLKFVASWPKSLKKETGFLCLSNDLQLQGQLYFMGRSFQTLVIQKSNS